MRKTDPDELLTMDEYLQVLRAVKSYQDDRLYAIVETICSAGLKYSELKYLTVEAIEAGLRVLTNFHCSQQKTEYAKYADPRRSAPPCA